MTRPSDRAIAQAFWKACDTVNLDKKALVDLLHRIELDAREIDAAAPDGAQFVTGTVAAVGSDESGQPRILIHTTREALRDGPMLACRDVFVSTATPSLDAEDAARNVMRETAKRCLRSYIESGSTDKALMLSCLEELS